MKQKSILIVGAGTGLSLGVARKFGTHGFSIGLISRNKVNLQKLQTNLSQNSIKSYYAEANVTDAVSLAQAIETLRRQMGTFDVVLYNVADVKVKDILEETGASLVEDFSKNVAAALDAYLLVQNDLKETQGAFLISGGGLALNPSADYGSLSIGKAGIRNLALQLHDRVKSDSIYVGILTIANIFSETSTTHSPVILADKFWSLYESRDVPELHQ